MLTVCLVMQSVWEGCLLASRFSFLINMGYLKLNTDICNYFKTCE